MEDFTIKFISEKSISLVVALTAITGGVARYAKSYLDTGEFSFKKFFANIFISGFAGLMFGYFGESMGVTGNAQLMFAGVGGFMGYEAVTFIFNQITRQKV